MDNVTDSSDLLSSNAWDFSEMIRAAAYSKKRKPHPHEFKDDHRSFAAMS